MINPSSLYLYILSLIDVIYASATYNTLLYIVAIAAAFAGFSIDLFTRGYHD